MIAGLLLGICFAQGGAPLSGAQGGLPEVVPQKSYFQKVIGRPTGQNGYEEFVRASELATSVEVQKLNIFQLWLATDRKKPLPFVIVGLGADASILDVKRSKLKASSEVRKLLAQGCQKRVYCPGEVKIDTLFFELAEFKSVAKLLIDCADAEVANGRPDEAVAIIRDTYHMGVLISDGILISALVGTAVRAIALLGAQRNSNQFSESGWRELERFGGQLLAVSPPEFLAYPREQAYMLATVYDILYRPKAFEPKELGLQMDWSDQLRRLPSAKKEQVMQQASARLSALYKPYMDRAKRPESEWILPIDEPLEVELPSDASPEQQFFAFLEGAAGFGGVLEAAARSRTQLRLLVLTARVHRFRYHHGRLPNSLIEAVGDAANDPLTGKPFIFEKLSGQEFRIASKGFKKLGEIDIVYRRQQAGPDLGGPIPPMQTSTYSR